MLNGEGGDIEVVEDGSEVDDCLVSSFVAPLDTRFVPSAVCEELLLLLELVGLGRVACLYGKLNVELRLKQEGGIN